MDESPAFFQLGVELLQVLLAQLVQRDLPSLRNDVPVLDDYDFGEDEDEDYEYEKDDAGERGESD